MRFHEETDQFIEQFKGQIIGQHFQYLLNTKTMFMNRSGYDLITANYCEHLTFCNPELTSETCACLFYANRRNEDRKSISIYNKSCSQCQYKWINLLLCYKINYWLFISSLNYRPENGKYLLNWDMSASWKLLRGCDFNPYYRMCLR